MKYIENKNECGSGELFIMKFFRVVLALCSALAVLVMLERTIMFCLENTHRYIKKETFDL